MDLVILPDEVFDHADAGEVFLHHTVETVVGLKDTLEYRVDTADDKIKTDAEDGNDRKEYKGDIVIDAEGHDHGEDEHGGTPDEGTNDHHKGVLHIADIGGQAGHQPGAAEFIDIGKGINLQMVEHIMAQVAGKARRGPGAAASRQCTEGQRHQRKAHQQCAVPQDHGHIAGLDAFIDEIGHNKGNSDVQKGFHQHIQRGKQGVFFIFPYTLGKSFNQ